MPVQLNKSSIWNIREIYKQTLGSCYSSGGYNVELLLIGGGGPGGQWGGSGGGGGAGGVIYTNNLRLEKGCSYPITIGAGGIFSAQGQNTVGANSCFCYTTGGPPSGINLISLGGGGGGNSVGLVPNVYYGARQGGSGGGEGNWVNNCTGPIATNNTGAPKRGCGLQSVPSLSTTLWSDVSGIVGYGFPGGIGGPQAPGSPCSNAWGGGGGGAGSCGCNGQPCTVSICPGGGAGNGGAGLTFSISGTPVGYAGGGAAGQESLFSPTQCCGRACGSGQPSAFCCGGGGTGTGVPVGNPGNYQGETGVANRGGGGAGGQAFGGGRPGGSGVAVISYPGSVQLGLGGDIVQTCFTPSIVTSHTFTGSGSFVA